MIRKTLITLSLHQGYDYMISDTRYDFYPLPDPRRPERVFWREGSPNIGTMPLSGDPSRQKTRSGRRGSGDGVARIRMDM
ncbi:hypothetical protein Lsha_2678 [Legionella shakespearei DSM 23087]|uniref:Uncharacterized protein n=1 Tax=Legionella shakespearei DSM 23087 TaxID=1122169 RepID=A0A0W0YK97_9GAMM|nr:hypothetical protein Lsha_2678 [Legionella shakespearei DSM 23087]